MDGLDNPIFSWAAVASTLLVILILRSILQIFPSLVRCIRRWKGNIELEDSLQLSRSRNLVAAVLFIPLCMEIYRYSIYSPSFLKTLPSQWQFPATAAILAAYILLREAFNRIFKRKIIGERVLTAANNSFYNYGILYFILLSVAGVLLSLTVKDPWAITKALRQLTLLSYLFYIFRRGQIFASSCGAFVSFLYLCELEIFPTGLLLISAVLL